MLGPLVSLSIKGISPVCSISSCLESMLKSPPSNKRPLGSSEIMASVVVSNLLSSKSLA